MYNDVVTFIKACDQEKNKDNAELYQTLVSEEYYEFMTCQDDTEDLDACMDLIWVILGYCYMKGFDVKGAWEEVARSNLSKIDSLTGKVLKREDGKVLKPEGWTPPDLSKFVGEGK